MQEASAHIPCASSTWSLSPLYANVMNGKCSMDCFSFHSMVGDYLQASVQRHLVGGGSPLIMYNTRYPQISDVHLFII